jgi:hypothetical protein
MSLSSRGPSRYTEDLYKEATDFSGDEKAVCLFIEAK